MKVRGYLTGRSEMQAQLGLVIYTGEGGALATIHKIVHTGDKVPVMLGGECLTHENLQELVKKMTESPQRRGLIPANVVLADADLLVWHTPAQHRVMFWETHTPLDALSGQAALYPPLLFIAKPRALYVFALTSDARPDADTLLWRAPVYNVYASGALCPGNVRLPGVPTPEAIPEYEQGFFRSSYAHTNMGASDLTTHRGGHTALWKSLHEARHRHFPFWSLVPILEDMKPGARQMTLGKVLKLK